MAERNYTTQMDAARRGIVTPEMAAVAKKEYRTEEEICAIIGADSLHYLPIEYLIKACKGKKCDYCAACFDGKYPVDVEKYNCGKFIAASENI